MNRNFLPALALAFSLAAIGAQAQQPQTVRIRGEIVKADGPLLSIRSRDGADLTVKLADSARVTAFVKASLADIKPNSYIGVTGMPEPDGSQRAIAIHIFAESQRGAAEGHRPWDARPNSTMTNAAVDSIVASLDGEVLMLKYKDGEKKVLVSKDTPVVAYAPGERSELVPGAKIMIFGAARKDDGSLEAPSIAVGRGLAPPM